MPKRKTPESLYTNEVIDELHKQGYIVKKIYNGGIAQRYDFKKKCFIFRKKAEEYKGVPDLIAYNVERKKFFFIEVKTKKGRVKPEQKEFIESFNNCTEYQAIVSKDDIDSLRESL